MSIFRHVRPSFAFLRQFAEALGNGAVYWGYCATCCDTTPRQINPMLGEVRCTRCGSSHEPSNG